MTTRQRLINIAHRRFYRDGFRNVGLDQIIGEAGISRTAFYKHFPSKEDLMLAMLEAHNDEMQRELRKLLREHGGPSAQGQLRALFDAIQHFIEGDDFHGCIFVNATMEFPLPHDPVHEAAQRNKQAICDLIFELGERAGVDDPAAMAQQLCLVLEGLYVTHVLTGGNGALDTAQHLGRQIIEAHLPARPKAAPESSTPGRPIRRPRATKRIKAFSRDA